MKPRKSARKEGRGPRGDRGELADRLLAAARSSFAARGYAATSLRAVAREARVDPALVSYYFETKRGLFDVVLMLPDGFLEGIAAAATAPLRRRGAALVAAMLSTWDQPKPAEILSSILSTAAHEPLAMAKIREVFSVNILRAIAEALPDRERRLRASLVTSQLVGLAMTRYLWKVGPIADLPPADLVRLLAPDVQRYLDGQI